MRLNVSIGVREGGGGKEIFFPSSVLTPAHFSQDNILANLLNRSNEIIQFKFSSDSCRLYRINLFTRILFSVEIAGIFS